jgi:hypothetical protein
MVGDVIRIQPNHISFNNVDAIEDIHGARSKLSKLEPYKTVYGSQTGVESIFTATSVFIWNELRVESERTMAGCVVFWDKLSTRIYWINLAQP